MQETTVFLSHFEDLPGYWQKGKVAYPLDEVLLVMLAAALSGAETVADIARFGQAKLSLLRRFRPFANGTPSHDQLGIILARLDPVAFQRCFVAWTAALTNTSAEVLAIEGAVVTIDAMGCQREIAQKIIDKRADYILALKGMVRQSDRSEPAEHRRLAGSKAQARGSSITPFLSAHAAMTAACSAGSFSAVRICLPWGFKFAAATQGATKPTSGPQSLAGAPAMIPSKSAG